MSIVFGVGLSVSTDSFQAGRNALKEALNGLEEIGNCLVIVFATDTYDHGQVLLGVKDKFPSDNIIGFTVAGIFNSKVMEKEGVVVGIIQSDEMNFLLSSEEDLSKDQYAAGDKLGEKFGQALATDESNALLMLFPDGITTTVSGMVDSLFNKLGSRAKYAGGGSGDNLRFLKTSQYLGDKVFKDAVVGALITSKKPIGVSLSHGWEPISPPLIVTNSEENVIYELDWQSAYDVYADFARDQKSISIEDEGFAQFAMSHPFGIPQAQEGDGYIVRDPINKGKDGSITCVGEVPENSVLRILHGDKISLLKAVKEAAIDAKNQIGASKVAGVVVFTCVSRCLILKDSFIDEIGAIREIMGNEVPLLGCMTFGEIGSIQGGPPEFHNKSVVICVFPK